MNLKKLLTNNKNQPYIIYEIDYVCMYIHNMDKKSLVKTE